MVAIAVSVRADYLYWSVGETETVGGVTKKSGVDYNYAALYAFKDGQSYHVASHATAYSGSDNLGTYGEGYSFYIELINYDSSSSTAALAGSTYDNMQTYAELSGSRWNGSDLIALASKTAFVGGSNYAATPEPTSGLLMLMGFAMLGLKRKKEV